MCLYFPQFRNCSGFATDEIDVKHMNYRNVDLGHYVELTVPVTVGGK